MKLGSGGGGGSGAAVTVVQTVVCGLGTGTGDDSDVGEKTMRSIKGFELLVVLDFEWIRTGSFVIMVR